METNKKNDNVYNNITNTKKSEGNNNIQPIIWSNVIAISLLHILFPISFFLTITKMKFLTIAWILVYGSVTGIGITAGAHRLWTHRSYKATLPLQIILLLFYSATGMNSIHDWVRDHRVHHKFSETDADPHNSNRGFFFAHVGWLMRKKHPDVIHKGKCINMSDITEDPLLKFHTRYFIVFKVILCYIFPTLVPVYLWQEKWLYAICSQIIIRYTWILNVTWSVNSVAHMWGQRPYNKTIRPVENVGISFATWGEGYHNYHHVFPWDYKAAELGNSRFNITTMAIDLFSKIGLAYDLKTASPKLIKATIEKYGNDTLSF